MCKPKIPKATQYQVAQNPTFADGDDEDAAKRRGRRGTILSTAAASSGTVNPAGGKTLLGQ